MNAPTLPPLPVIQLAPLPPVKVTGWIPIVDKPVRSGYYDLLTIDGDVERRYFNHESGNWLCVSGKEPWTIYTFWRGVAVQ